MRLDNVMWEIDMGGEDKQLSCISSSSHCIVWVSLLPKALCLMQLHHKKSTNTFVIDFYNLNLISKMFTNNYQCSGIISK